jgi:lysophospholipase L1-like esterase
MMGLGRRLRRKTRCYACGLVGLALLTTPPAAGAADADRWVATWGASSQKTEEANLPPAPGFADTTLRQVAHVTIGGRTLRVRFANSFGRTALSLVSAHVARSSGGSRIRVSTDTPLTFHGRSSIEIPEGALMVSDPVDFDVPPLSDLAVTVRLKGAPADVTGHPGSRTTSYLTPGEAVSAADLAAPGRADHWYFLNGIDVRAGRAAAAVAILGDSITDGRGSTTNGNDRWPDDLARRLQSNSGTAEVAVVNQGIGGNRLLRDGLGPNALARLDRDVLALPGVRWLVVLEGINDIGTRAGATADDLIAAYEQIVARTHARDIRVYGATILPFGGAQYFTADGEADRQKVNEWIRNSGVFDAVIDFDATTRDPKRPQHLSPAVDGGDHLHPSAAGYQLMADSIDLGLFLETASIR